MAYQKYLHLQAVLFDLYGTLINVDTDESSERFWTELAAELADLSVVVDPSHLALRFNQLCSEEAASHGDGRILDQVFRRWRDEVAPGGSRQLGVTHFARLFRQHSTRVSVPRYTMSLLKRLHKGGVKLAIVSNTESIFTRIDLKDLNLTQYFENIVLSSDTAYEKPDPRIVELGRQPLGVAAEHTVFVGDSWTTDVRAALASEIPAIYLRQATDDDRVELDGRVIVARPNLRSIEAALRKADELLGRGID